MTVERFITGKPETVRKLNALVDAVKSLQNLNGDIFIRAANTPAGTTVRLNFAAILERIMKNRGGGSQIRIAYCKTDAPDANTIEVYLDTDETGEQVTAECFISNGSSLLYAAPFLKDGQPVFVSNINGTWYIVGVPFSGAKVIA